MLTLENREQIKKDIKKKTSFIQFSLENGLSYNRLTSTLNGYHVYGEVIDALRNAGCRPRVRVIEYKNHRRFKYQYAISDKTQKIQ